MLVTSSCEWLLVLNHKSLQTMFHQNTGKAPETQKTYFIHRPYNYRGAWDGTPGTPFLTDTVIGTGTQFLPALGLLYFNKQLS